MTDTPTQDDIKAARRKLGLSHQRFAALMGYGHKARSIELENGKRIMSGPAAKLFRLLTGEIDFETWRKGG